MKQLVFSLLLSFVATSSFAQVNSYEDYLRKGNELINSGCYEEAKRHFALMRSRFSAKTSEINSKIATCDSRIAAQNQRRAEAQEEARRQAEIEEQEWLEQRKEQLRQEDLRRNQITRGTLDLLFRFVFSVGVTYLG